MTDGSRFTYNRTVDTAKSNYRLIREAYRSLNKEKFQEAILILEKVLSSGVGDIYVLLLLSVAYLYTGQFGKLARFVTKMKDMNSSYLPLKQMEAFLKLKSAAGQAEALQLYIDLTARYPADAHLHRGRSLIGAASDFSALQKNARLQDFVNIPRPDGSLKKAYSTNLPGPQGRRMSGMHRNARIRVTLIAMISVAGLTALAGTGVWYLVRSGMLGDAVSKIVKPNRDYSSIDMVSVSGMEYDLVKNIKKDRVAVYYQSARDMTDDFNRARQLIKAERHNDAVIMLNGLYNSNVNFVVKEKVEFLIKFIMNQEDRHFDEIPYPTVGKNKYRYRGYAVRWKGRVDAVREKDRSQIVAVTVDDARGEPAGAVDVYSGRIIPGLKKGARVLMEGIIVDFLGTDKRIYVDARNMRVIKDE
ncbi:MAG: hypothetical protein A2176_15970 [Spirochaetes bacterium RBG_13_51_14]|nr:MAG: hypothetical protein A2176_15970 [Spirochaetes bacterium RBG_13_51_14]